MTIQTKPVTRKVGPHHATLRLQERKDGKHRIVVVFTRGPLKDTKKQPLYSSVIRGAKSLNPKRILRYIIKCSTN